MKTQATTLALRAKADVGESERRSPSDKRVGESEGRSPSDKDDELGRSESINPDNVCDIADEGAGHRG